MSGKNVFYVPVWVDLWFYNFSEPNKHFQIFRISSVFLNICNFIILQEALELSKLKAELTLRHVPLYAVVHESLGVEQFSPFFKGDGIFLDAEVCCVIIVLYFIFCLL